MAFTMTKKGEGQGQFKGMNEMKRSFETHARETPQKGSRQKRLTRRQGDLKSGTEKPPEHHMLANSGSSRHRRVLSQDAPAPGAFAPQCLKGNINLFAEIRHAAPAAELDTCSRPSRPVRT